LCVIKRAHQLDQRPIDNVAGERYFIDPQRAVGEVLPQSQCRTNQQENKRDQQLRGFGERGDAGRERIAPGRWDPALESGGT
jgi:hypothetical protein